jgi:hypothetical protein
MIPSLLFALALGATDSPPSALSVTFPDLANPNFYHVMSCRGGVRQRTRFRLGRDGAPSPKSGTIVFRCDGPMTTQIQRIPFEPGYFHDTDWAWKFETVDGKEMLAGSGAKVMTPPVPGLRLYVREGYLEP